MEKKLTYMHHLRDLYNRFAWRDISGPVEFGVMECDDKAEAVARAGKLLEDTGLSINRNYSVAEIAALKAAVESVLGVQA